MNELNGSDEEHCPGFEMLDHVVVLIAHDRFIKSAPLLTAYR